MADFTRQDLAGSRFEQVDLSGARWNHSSDERIGIGRACY